MKKISVNVSDEIHTAVRMRAFRDGVAMGELGRVWFETYAVGGTIVASSPTVSPREGTFAGGLGAGETHEKVGRPVRPDGADAATDAHVSSAPSPDGLGAADENPMGQTSPLRSRSSAAPNSLKPHRADPKTKASQEHGKGAKKVSTGLCEHRVPVGSFCRRCEEGT